MKIEQSQILLIEALLDGELTGEDLLSAMELLDSSKELQSIYNTLKAQKHAFKHAFFQSHQQN